MTRLLPLLLAALLAPGTAFGLSVLKCVGPDGAVVMSDPPCPAGYSVQVQHLKPNVLQSDGLRKWAEKHPERSGPSTRYGQESRNPYTPVAFSQVDPAECENARRAYDFEAGYRFRKADVLQAKRREMELKCSRR
ncbi:MAG: hypothetical protein V4729_14620 [Pseudomonadota bacterium]